MHRVHVESQRLQAESIQLGREESRHLKSVLRVQPGDEIELFDGAGLTRSAVIESVEKNAVSITPTATARSHPLPQCAITLFACISKGKRMDWSVEKAVELGVSRIVPVVSDRTVVRLSPEERASKAERWTRVATDALRQCGGAWLPEIRPAVDFPDALELVSESLPVFTAALCGESVAMRDALRNIPEPPAGAGWFVGPEGDFTPSELEQLRAAKTTFVSLGSHVLRAETAAVYGLCVLGCAWL